MGRAVATDLHILDAAADWHAELEGDAPDYDGFATWLEADVRHRDAYDQVIALDTLLADRGADLTPSLAANDDAPLSRVGRWRWAGMAAALALVIGTGALTLRDANPGQVVVATNQGQTRTIQFADATMVTLDGNSAFSYARDSERTVVLAQGSAHFAVHHDAAKPFSISAGGYQIRDLGTEFSVSQSKDHLSISVATGLVDIAGPGVTRLALHPRERIDIAGGKFEKSRIDPSSVGSWRQGRLVYNDTPLRLVVADINRYAVQPVQLDPALSDRRFSGVLTIGDGSRLASTLANVMAVPLESKKGALLLGAGNAR